MKLFSDSFYYHCEVHQSKPRLPYLLILHGFMGSGKVFIHLIDKLSSYCNPITIDLAGHGDTESPDDPIYYSTERQVQQLYSIIRRLQFDDLYLYGYSMGGRLAFQLMASHPNLFAGVIIESSHCGIELEEERLKRQKLDEERAHQIGNNFEGFIEEWSQMSLFEHTPDPMKAVYQKVMKAQNPKTMSASLRGFGAGAMPSVCDKICESNLLLTLIAGELDQKYIERMTAINEKTENSNLKIVKSAGHRVHTDQPGELIQILKRAVS